MTNNNTLLSEELYDVVFFWKHNKNDTEYKQYCGETLCNILGYTAPLSVKLVYEAAKKNKALIYSTRNINKAVELRDTLNALDLECQICPAEKTKGK